MERPVHTKVTHKLSKREGDYLVRSLSLKQSSPFGASECAAL